MMEYKDFKTQVAKTDCPRKAKITNSWGVYDCYKAIRKNKWMDIGKPVKEHEFYSIIRGVNTLMAEELANGREIHFPSRMGKLELRKIERGVSLVDGKLKNTYPINWDETLRLWFKDEEARKDKTLLRNEEKYIFHIKYNKYNANYENQCFYEFQLNRFIKIALKENINKGKIDTLW